MASQSVASVLGPYVTVRVADLGRLDPLVRTGDAKAIHDMRVSARRLKSVLVAYRSAFDPETGKRFRTELDWLADVLGDARDPEVQRLILLELAVTGDDVVQVEAASRALAVAAQERLDAALTSQRYQVLAQELKSLGADPAWTPIADHPAHKFVSHALEGQLARLESRIAAAKPSAPRSTRDERLHRVRKSVKRARYATEAATPVLADKATHLIKQLADAQDVLGAHNDLVATRAHAHAWTDRRADAIDPAVIERLDARVEQSRRDTRSALTTLQGAISRR